ncbi:MATE family efflux transporter [Halopseudomonas aestusnigri]|jgi:MATE family multidrug resistance protein|uniref:MATE family efflux transporter n=1 Tax=Halopseudomonas TaxID=2901189 RepID=UPI000C8F35EA|nr:MATE family efflux transporter [Halopseudomonas aestusnigri]MAP75615.1 MATE family efflux transporter [Pseudomonadales bacterium]UGV32597.1 MATE family efflux transporter [Halopseudomonas aestusnigri]HBT58210.1 MATE family efflux transporter [Pseudomonas sp.]HCP02680.1 MATE family efflux transporter [Pseudomonas sp.]|tara:strand:+ start:8780 stop:10171 length:1392 start_codon:yes stop_codon:yes gene_type:complete
MTSTPPLPARARIVTELRALIALVLPIIAAQLAHTLLGFVDTAMAGRVSAEALAAVALGNSFWIPTLLFLTGVMMIVTSKVAAANGAGRISETGALVRQGAWLGLMIGCGCMLFLNLMRPVLGWMEVDPQLVPVTLDYLLAISLGFPAVGVMLALRGLSDGLSRTKPAMLIGFIGLLINVPANYVLVYGKFGFPAMGAVGCGVATAIVMWAMLGCLLVHLKRASFYQPCGLFERFDWPKARTQGELIGLGFPIGMALFAETSMFAVIALLIGSLGAIVVAAHQVTLNFTSLAFMVPFSLGLAITVRVGHNLGRGGARDAMLATQVGLVLALLFAAIAAIIMYTLASQIPLIYTQDPQVLALASSLFVLAALYQFSDAVQVACAGALRGFQDTRLPMLLTMIAYWLIGLPTGYVLGLTDWLGPARGPAGFWIGLIVGLSSAALFLGLRLRAVSRKPVYQHGLQH